MNPDALLNDLRHLQVKPKDLHCLANNDCWCMKVQARFVHADDNECMSPQEMLNQASVMLSESDRVYLQSLTSRNFINSNDTL